MKDLEDYFDAARKKEPLHSLQDVRNIINTRREHTRHSLFDLDQLFSTRKSFIYLSLTVSTMLLALIISLIMLPGTQTFDQEVFIPDSQKRIMRLMNGIAFDSTSSAIRLSPVGNKAVKKMSKAIPIPIHLRSTLRLSKETLALLGIVIKENEVRYEGNVKGSGYIELYATKTNSGLTVKDDQEKGVKEYDFYPLFLTDEDGTQRVRYRFENEPPLKMTNSFFSNTMDQLIPVMVPRPGGANVIFWFCQTDALMRILESAANVPTTPDVATEAQDDDLASSIEIQLYPTITKGEVIVSAKISKTQKLEITVLNRSGEVVKVPVVNQTLDEGEHAFSMDLSEFQKGLYFIRIQSQPGITTIHRIFKN